MEKTSLTVNALIQHVRKPDSCPYSASRSPQVRDFAFAFFTKHLWEWKVLFQGGRAQLSRTFAEICLKPAPVQLYSETLGQNMHLLRWHMKWDKPAFLGWFTPASWQLDTKPIFSEHINKLSIWKSYSNFVAGGYFGNNSSLGTQAFDKSGLKTCSISMNKTSEVEGFN